MPKLTTYQKLVAKAAIQAAQGNFAGWDVQTPGSVAAYLPQGTRAPSARQLASVAHALGWSVRWSTTTTSRKRGGYFGRNYYWAQHTTTQPSINTASILAWVEARKAAIATAKGNT